MNIKQQFKEGLITNNPVLVQLIGMCATMAITTSLFNGIGMGLSCLLYTSPSPRDRTRSRMPSSA